jgi:signal transduction histidine kinase
LGLLLLGAYLLARTVGRPLAGLAGAATAVAQGDMGVQIRQGSGGVEVRALSRAFSGMIGSLRERENRLRQQNLDLENANRDYQELLSFVTHELNNSMGSLLLNISLLAEDSEEDTFSDEQREIVDQLLRDVERFRDMVRNYLNLSRLEKGSLRYQPRMISVRSEIVEPILKRLSRWITHRGIRVTWDWPPQDVRLSADPDLLEICYSNLLVNAIKYGQDWITLAGRRAEEFWSLEVANGGPPIPQEKIGLLFQKFSRLVKSDDGAGLGLYLVKQIMDRHGGEVTCVAGEHTVFSLKLPAIEETP